MQLRTAIEGVVVALMVAASATMIYTASTLRANSNAIRAKNEATVYQVGDTFGGVPDVRFDQHPRTVVLFLQSTCKFCTDSAPFYRRLLAQPNRPPVIVVGYEDAEVLQRYLADLGVFPDRSVQAVPGAVRLLGTPALVVVTNEGKVERLWRGQLDAKSEDLVLEQVLR